MGNPGVGNECCDEIVDLACGDAANAGLHHQGEQRLVDAAAALQHAWEERALPQLRYPQAQTPAMVVRARVRLRWLVQSPERSKKAVAIKAVSSGSISS